VRLRSNILKNRDELKYRRIKVSNPKLRSAVFSVAGGRDVLLAIGFQPETDEELVLPANANLVQLLQMHDACDAALKQVAMVAPQSTTAAPATAPAATSATAEQQRVQARMQARVQELFVHLSANALKGLPPNEIAAAAIKQASAELTAQAAATPPPAAPPPPAAQPPQAATSPPAAPPPPAATSPPGVTAKKESAPAPPANLSLRAKLPFAHAVARPFAFTIASDARSAPPLHPIRPPSPPPPQRTATPTPALKS
jgi:biotin carboxyl carrier protein